MTDNVTQLNAPYVGEIEPDTILENNKGNFDEILLIGWNKEGDFRIAASNADLARALVLIESARDDVMRRIHGFT